MCGACLANRRDGVDYGHDVDVVFVVKHPSQEFQVVQAGSNVAGVSHRFGASLPSLVRMGHYYDVYERVYIIEHGAGCVSETVVYY